MMITKEKILEAVKRAKEQGGKKNFRQGLDISIALDGLDPKKPESRITLDVVLPHGAGRPNKILVFADGELAREQKGGETSGGGVQSNPSTGGFDGLDRKNIWSGFWSKGQNAETDPSNGESSPDLGAAASDEQIDEQGAALHPCQNWLRRHAG